MSVERGHISERMAKGGEETKPLIFLKRKVKTIVVNQLSII